MELGEPDDSGRRRPVPIAGSEHDIDTDLVVFAIGTNANATGESSTALGDRAVAWNGP